MSEYKAIVLLKGLHSLNEQQFKTIKSILKTALNLTEEYENDYDRIKIADLMEKTFKGDAGLGMLIKLCQDMKGLEDLVEKLKTEKAKVKKQKKTKNKTAVKKGKQEEPSSSQSVPTNNELYKSKTSSKKKRKQTENTEGGKKKKLTEEQTWLSEPSGSNRVKDEGCLQTPPKPPPTPSSSSSSKKNTNIKKPSTKKTQVSQKKHQLPEFSATSNSSAGSELHTLQDLSATAFSSLQTPQKHLETCFTLKAFPGSPAPPCQNFPVSPASYSSIHLNSPVPLTLSSGVQAPHVSSATASASSSLLDPRVVPATVSSALQARLMPPATTGCSPSRTPKRENLPKEPSKVEGHHRDPKEVMVLKVTEAFTYDLVNDKKMFHATVATETEFFRVKVFDMALKNKFIPKKIIAISDYFGVNGFLEIYGPSCVSDVNVNGMMIIPKTLKQRANGTPKIKEIFSQEKGTYVNGEFLVTKKNERNDFIYYGIEDNTGKMEVVVYGRLTSIKCEPGKKLRLVCFELTTSGDMWQLKSVRHSYMQVINARRKVTQS